MHIRSVAVVALLLAAGCCKCEKESIQMLEQRVEKLERRLDAMEAKCRSHSGFSVFRAKPSANTRATELPNMRRSVPKQEALGSQAGKGQ